MAKIRKTSKQCPSLQRARLVDVAQEAGVSRQTAGAVLLGGRSNARASEATAKRVLEAARKLQYQPNQAARHLKGRRMKLVGVLNRIRSDDDAAHSLIARDILEKLAAEGFIASTATYVEGGKSRIGQVRDLIRLGMDGLFVLDTEFPKDAEALEQVLELCPRTLFFPGGYTAPETLRNSVDVNRRVAAQTAVGHLIERGRRRIGVFAGHEDQLPAQSRLAGYRSTLSDNGLDVDDTLVFESARGFLDTSFNPDEMRTAVANAIDQLVVQGGADAIFTFAFGALGTITLIQALQERGYRVPEDVAIATVRDYPIYQAFRPSVTAVSLHHDGVAQPMVDMLGKMMTDDACQDKTNTILVKPELMIRETSP